MSQLAKKDDGFVVTQNGQRVGQTVPTQEAAEKKAKEVRQDLQESPGTTSTVAVKRQLNG